MRRPIQLSRPARRALATLGFGLGLTLVGALATEWLSDRRQTENLFHVRGSEAALALVAAIQRNVLGIEQMTAFHEAAGGRLSETQFRTVALEVLRQHPDIAGIGWVPLVPANHLEAFVAGERAGRSPDYRVFSFDAAGRPQPSERRPVYYPIQYAEPEAVYQRGLGFDIGSDPLRMGTLSRAARTGQAQTSVPLPMAALGNGRGVFVAHPIANSGGPGLYGFLVETIAIDRITRTIGSADPAHPLALTVDGSMDTAPPAAGRLIHRATIPVLGATWQVTIRPAGEWKSDTTAVELGWFAALTGLILSVGVALYVHAKNLAHERLSAAHQAAEEHRREFQLLSELSSDGAYHFSFESESVPLLWASDGFYRLIGWRAGDQHTRNDWLTLIHPEDRPRVARGFALAARGTGSTAEYRVYTPEGYRWVEDVIQPGATRSGQTPVEVYGALRDITERREATEALRLANAELEAAFAAIPDMYFRLDRDGRFVSYRAGSSAILYRQPEAFIGKHLEEVLPASVAAMARDGMARIQATGSPTSIEYPMTIGDAERWFETRAFPGREGEALLFVRDITHRRTREEELAASENRFRTLITTLPEPLMIVEEGSIIFANRAAERFYGAPTPALVGLPCHDLLVGSSASLGEVCDARDGAAALPIELTFRRHDETPVAVEVVVAPTAFDGRAAVQIAFRDVSIRKAAEDAVRVSEERFRQLAESADGVFWLFDPVEGTVPYVSPQAATVFGAAPTAPNQPFADWNRGVHSGDRERAAAAMRACTTGRTTEFDIDFRVIRPDGTVRWVNDRARRIVAGGAPRILGFARDITDKRLAEESRTRLEAQLRNVQKMEAIGTLAGGIAHDFNNILGAVMGYASLLELELADQPRAMADLNQILAASTRAKALVQQILTFSRQQDQIRSAIRLQPVLREAIGLLRAGIPSSIELETTLDPGAPKVMADGTQVHQILMNLVTNAADAIGETGVITVRYEACNVTPTLATLVPELEPGAYTRLTVSDTGPGMDAATVERIFEPFFTTKAPGKGTGLGLAVVHGIVKAHDGAIGVSSEPGHGTTFDVYFPVAVDAAPAEPDQGDDGMAFGHGEHILVVDDEGPLALVCRKMLEARGYRVSTYTRPDEGLAAFRESPDRFHVAVLDFTMPGMSGAALADQMSQLRPDFPILIMTGYAAALSESAIEKLGVRRLLLKPLQIKALVNAVAETLSEAANPKEL